MTIHTDNKRIVLFDADGTLRRCTIPGQPCPNRDGEWELLPGVREKISTLKSMELICLVSNQAGIAYGHLTHEMANLLLRDLLTVVLDGLSLPKLLGASIECCPHAVDAGCICRKPSPFMLLFATANLVGPNHPTLRRDEVLFVGDMRSDKEAAERAGIEFAWACEFFGWDEPCIGKKEEAAIQKECEEHGYASSRS